MEIIFEKISFQPTRYELCKLKTFRNIFKRKKIKTHRAGAALAALTIWTIEHDYLVNLYVFRYKESIRMIIFMTYGIASPIMSYLVINRRENGVHQASLRKNGVHRASLIFHYYEMLKSSQIKTWVAIFCLFCLDTHIHIY